MEKIDICEKLSQVVERVCPEAPPPPGPTTISYSKSGLLMNRPFQRRCSLVPKETRDLWEHLFEGAYKADVIINTENGGVIHAHASILVTASPVFGGLLKKSRIHGGRKSLAILGVPYEAARAFIRFLYSSCYDQEEMEKYVLHLLVLSHAYVIPQLKHTCQQQLERGMLNTENVVDIFQIALLCDVPRLSIICHRMIVKNFKAVVASDGWKAMKQSHPVLEKELLKSLIEEEDSRKERLRKENEKRTYSQLYDAMEALVHICKDGCRTIGPHDKVFTENREPCTYEEACKGLEVLVRHFAGCKLRVPGGCGHCKRLWRLLELHSRLCADSDLCRVPLCRNFKNRTQKQNRKEEIKWGILVKKILRSKTIRVSPYFSAEVASKKSC